MTSGWRSVYFRRSSSSFDSASFSLNVVSLEPSGAPLPAPPDFSPGANGVSPCSWRASASRLVVAIASRLCVFFSASVSFCRRV